jgi:hypothetical protein
LRSRYKQVNTVFAVVEVCQLTKPALGNSVSGRELVGDPLRYRERGQLEQRRVCVQSLSNLSWTHSLYRVRNVLFVPRGNNPRIYVSVVVSSRLCKDEERPGLADIFNSLYFSGQPRGIER